MDSYLPTTKKLVVKIKKLKDYLVKLDSAIIAFSGGVDSSTLAKVAFDVLGEGVVAVTAISPTYSCKELNEARKIAKKIGIKHIAVNTNEFNDKRFLRNQKDRCYWCKKELFSRLDSLKRKFKFRYVVDGSNYSDKFDHRPGFKANKEFKVISPFYDLKFTKTDVRSLARQLGLGFWNKPNQACFASRIPFNSRITVRRLKKVKKAERILQSFFGKNILLRGRDHGEILRIEIAKQEWTKLQKSDINTLARRLKKTGYKYITFDLEGYIPAGKR